MNGFSTQSEGVGPRAAARRQRDPLDQSAAATRYAAAKAPWMRLLALVLLVAFAPVIFGCMLLVRLTSRGPALFRQTRLGKDGRPFVILKIRTMTCDAERDSGAVLCQLRDNRVTLVGRVLRFLHLDELPQLVNVLRGEMCLVGPRPERPEIIAKHRLNDVAPGFDDRTRVLPGVTGLAQINLPADQTAGCVVTKVKLDLEYIATASAHLDLRILTCTALRMLGVRHGRAVRLLGLDRTVHFDRLSTARAAGDGVAPSTPRTRRRTAAAAPTLALVGGRPESTGSSSQPWNGFDVENDIVQERDFQERDGVQERIGASSTDPRRPR